MTHALVAGKSGWGKSWLCQQWTEDNAGEYDHLLVLDYKDEYRGLVKDGLAQWAIAGPGEVGYQSGHWAEVLESCGSLVLARHRLRTEDWQDVCASAIMAARRLSGSVLVVVDEAHFVAPQSGAYPDAIEGLATTGRGEGVSSMWVSQRLARLDETVIAQMMMFVLGGFRSDADLSKLRGIVDYPADIHSTQASTVHNLPEALHVDGDPLALRQFKDDGGMRGSEWVHSTDSGDLKRIDSRELEMQSTHYGPEGQTLSTPG